MNYFHWFQFVVYSFCIYGFTVFTYVVYYYELLWFNRGNVLQKEYDYIIVGSGTAGSLIAHRLATETNYTYIVLEAGGRGHSWLRMPILGPLLHGSVFDWGFQTVPQENACLAMKDNKCRIPQGKIVGGSTQLNNMVHIRGNISHYADWFHGKYTTEYILNQFEYIENIFSLDELRFQSDLADAVLEAAKEIGYKILNLNHNHSLGFMKSRLTQKHGERWSISKNLVYNNLITNTVVDKVLVDEYLNAYGISFSQNGRQQTTLVRKGIILSAGAFNTPKILQLSGLGPRELLESLDIPIINDLPVGKNLQDHVTTGFDLIHFSKSLNIGPGDTLNPYNIFQYIYQGLGPFTSPGCEVVGFLSTNNLSYPDIQFMVLPVGITSDKGSRLRKALGIKDYIWNKYFVNSIDKQTGTILPILLHPKSKGTVLIKSRDPNEPPYINPRYLSERSDITTLVKGLKLVSEFINTDAMQILGAQLNPDHFPGCEKFVIYSDLYWECYVTHVTLTSYHPVGTCSMGLPKSKTSVVDTSFTVHGVKNLFVADGSVLPTLPSGNINAAIAMMASVFFENTILTPKINLRNEICLKKDYLLNYMQSSA